ncbi:MAG TPA: signal peptidase I [Tepidisphaeraceae bacterium]|jgi:signal peptidase I
MKRKHLRRLWRDHIRPILFVLLVGFSFKSAVADWNTVPTGSMKPTILEGDRIWVNKLAYGLKVPFTTYHLARWNVPARGEIVIFNSPKDGVRLVKRIIGQPGDIVELRDDRLIINGVPATYAPPAPVIRTTVPPGERSVHELAMEQLYNQSHPVMATPSVNAMRNFGPVTVPASHYLVFGDNRDNSADSRYIGFVPVDNIVGRSSRVVLSLNYDHYWLPRSERWFYALP